jgi:hypothetical protein
MAGHIFSTDIHKKKKKSMYLTLQTAKFRVGDEASNIKAEDISAFSHFKERGWMSMEQCWSTD